MPLNVRRFCTSVFLVLFSFVLITQAQQTGTPTSGDVMRERISKAKAFIAVRNYSASIVELESIRRESNDDALKGGVTVLLMNSYLEQGDFKRAQDLLNEFYTAQKTTKPNAPAFYMAVAGQVVKSARTRVERYRSLGLSVSDRMLPLEATNDLEKMRETVELVITQSKEIGKDKAKTADAMALLEEASNSRSMLARDDYDARRWHDEVADSREALVNGRNVVTDAVNNPPADAQKGEYIAVVKKDEPLALPAPVVEPKSAATRDREVKPSETKPIESEVARNDKPVYIPSAPPKIQVPNVREEPKPTTETQNNEPAETAPASPSTIDVGSLVGYATKQPSPVYPPAARNMGTKGIVRVDVTIDEAGHVTEVQKTSGPPLLQGAATDAIKKWKFKPFIRDGQPVRATGFVSFNFN